MRRRRRETGLKEPVTDNRQIESIYKEDNAMKRMSSCLVLSILILFAYQLSYAETVPFMDKAEKGFQEQRPFPMMPPMPCPMEKMREMPGFGHPLLMDMDKLKLDEKQKDALKEIENNTSKELIRKRAEEQIAEIELREFLDRETVDLKAVETKIKQIAGIKTEIQLIVIKSMENMKAKLTSEQIKTLKKLRMTEHQMRPPLMAKIMRNKMKVPPANDREKGEEPGE